MHFPTGGFEDEAKSQQRSEEAERKCHCHLLEMQSSDFSQTKESLVLKCYSISLSYSNFSPVSQMIFLSLGSCRDRPELTLLWSK